MSCSSASSAPRSNGTSGSFSRLILSPESAFAGEEGEGGFEDEDEGGPLEVGFEVILSINELFLEAMVDAGIVGGEGGEGGEGARVGVGLEGGAGSIVRDELDGAESLGEEILGGEVGADCC